MAQTKIYPATQAQAQDIQDTVDEINAKIVTPNYQVKTVTPSNVQQTVQPDNGYNALWSVTVEPIAAAMPESLESFIMNSSVEPFSITLNGAVPAYACYQKTNLKRVYGSPSSIEENAFYNCINLEEIDLQNVLAFGNSALEKCKSLKNADVRSLTNINHNYIFRDCSSMQSIDLRNLKTISSTVAEVFVRCSNLKYIDLRNVEALSGGYMFSGAKSLVLIDVTSNPTPVTLFNNSFFAGVSSTWILVVADDAVKTAYQSSTNWSTYASHVKTIAEVEAEVGMTYDEYYLQCFGHPRFDN